MSESDNNREITRRQLLNMASPLGLVTLSKPGCTLCGNCAAVCRTGALSMSFDSEQGTCRLLFRHGLCTACGECPENCPERCLKVERVMDIGGIDRPPEVLAEDRVVFCAECGEPLTSRTMVDRILTRLDSTGNTSSRYLETCPTCKARPRLSGVGR